MIAPSQRAAPNDPRQQPRAAHPQPTHPQPTSVAGAGPEHGTEAWPAQASTPSRASNSKTSQAASLAQRLIGEYPVVAVCTAAALGAALGWLVKRRR